MRRNARGILLAIVLLAYWIPLLWLALTGLKQRVDATAIPPRFIFVPTLRNFSDAFGTDSFGSALANSCVIASAVTIVCMLLGAPAGYAISRIATHKRSTWLLAFLGTRMLPAVTMLVPIYTLSSWAHMLDTPWVVIAAQASGILGVTVFLSYWLIQRVPTRLDEMAMLDGHNRLMSFLRVLVPVVAPDLTVVATVVFILAWGEYASASILGNFAARTLPVGVPGLVSSVGTRWGEVGAVSVIAMVPGILVAVFGREFTTRLEIRAASRARWVR